MARIPDIDRRLDNWARWRHGMTMGGLGYASVDMASEGIRETRQEATIPTMDCEAEETDRAVMALASELRATVEAVYLQGGTIAAKARRLVCAEATVYARIDLAHKHISRWLAQLAATRREHRARMDALQASARPKGPLGSFSP